MISSLTRSNNPITLPRWLASLSADFYLNLEDAMQRDGGLDQIAIGMSGFVGIPFGPSRGGAKAGRVPEIIEVAGNGKHKLLSEPEVEMLTGSARFLARQNQGNLSKVQSEIAGQIETLITLKEIGYDIGRGDNISEGMAAVRFQKSSGLKMRWCGKNSPHDWVDQNGTTYDAMGPFPGQHLDKQINSGRFLEQLDKHTNGIKADYLVIDYSLLFPYQIKRIDQLIEQLPKVQQLRIKKIGLP